MTQGSGQGVTGVRSAPERQGAVADVAQKTSEQAGNVASTVAEQAGQVASEAGTQARNLMDEGKDQIRTQVETGRRKVAESLHDMAAELRRMSSGPEASGPVAQLARQSTHHVERAASWLDEQRPENLVEEVRRFARRRPGVFLTGAVAAGVLIGRLTRNAMSGQQTDRPDRPGFEVDRPAGRAPARTDMPMTATGTTPPIGTPAAGPMSPGTPFSGSTAGVPGAGPGVRGDATGAGPMTPLDGDLTERTR